MAWGLHTGNVMPFVDSQFSEERLGEQIEVVAGYVRRIDAEPMPLRSIFTVLRARYGNVFLQGRV